MLRSHKHAINYDKERTPSIVRSQVFTASLRAPSAGISIFIFPCSKSFPEESGLLLSLQ